MGVGFIALLGLAAETGVVMLVYLNGAYERFRSEGRMSGIPDLKTAIMAGSAERVRPILMTTGTTMIGLLPIMFGTETGTRVMKRIAAPMVGGLVSSTLLTLIVLPAIYLLWKRLELRGDFALAEAAKPKPDVGARGIDPLGFRRMQGLGERLAGWTRAGGIAFVKSRVRAAESTGGHCARCDGGSPGDPPRRRERSPPARSCRGSKTATTGTARSSTSR